MTLVASVVACTTFATSPAPTPATASTWAVPRTSPSMGSCGVVSTLAVHIPSADRSATSVNVPPMSTASSARPVASVEDDDTSRDFARLQCLEGVVHIFERNARRNELVQLEPALQIHLHENRHVDAKAVRPHARPLDALLAHQLFGRQLEHRSDRDHADDRRGPAQAQHGERLLGGDLHANCLESVID